MRVSTSKEDLVDEDVVTNSTSTSTHTITPGLTAVDLDEAEEETPEHDGWNAAKAAEYVAARGHGIDRPFKAGCAKFPPIVIPEPTGFAHPRQRVLRQQEVTALQPIIDDLVKTGSIKQTDRLSGFCCPIHAVRKPTAPGAPTKFRLVTDLRLLNVMTPQSTFDTSETLAETARRLAGTPDAPNTRFAKLDLKSFFFQFGIAPESQHLFGFMFAGKCYQFTCLTMGYKNSSSWTAKFMASIFSDEEQRRYKLGAYVDDLGIAGRDSRELLANLDFVLQRLAQFGLVLNADKSVIDATSILFAGILIGPGSISLADEHLQAIRSWVPCTTRAALSRFVGLTRWVSHFCPKFATLIAPLEARLLTAKTTLTFSATELESFNSVKAALTSGEFLVNFNENYPLLIYSDSSDIATGSSLLQRDANGDLHVLAYCSRRFNSAQRGYSIRQRELYGFVVCAEKFAAWFARAPSIQCFTDHQSLQSILVASKQESDRVARWCCLLSQYAVTFTYIKGSQNCLADAISRRDLGHAKRAQQPAPTAATTAIRVIRAYNIEVPPTTVVPLPSFFLPRDWLPALLLEYSADVYFADLCTAAVTGEQSDNQPTSTRVRSRFLSVDGNGVVWNTAVQSQPRLALPEGTIRDKLVREVHASTGHLHHTATTAALKSAFFFPTMAATVEHAIEACDVCKADKHKTTATGRSNDHSTPQRRLGSLAIDVFSGLTEIAGFNQVLLIRDQLTKITVLAPLSANAGAAEIITALETHWFRVYGFPDSVYCDKGSYFTAKRFTQYCSDNHILLSFATTDHHVPEAERAIRTARERLRTMSHTTGDWLNALHLCELAMNRMVSRSDGYSASQRLFGFDIALPLLPTTEEARVSPRSGCDRSAETLMELIDAFYVAKEKSAAQHDKGRIPSGIAVGALVMVKRKLVTAADSAFGNKKAAKSRPPFVGPYLVTKDEGYCNWRLSGLEDLRVDPVFHESVLKLHTKHAAPAATQAGLRFGDLTWPDGSRRVQQVLDKRSWHGAVQYLVRLVGSVPTDPGVWFSYSQLHSVDQQKISEFDSSSAGLQLSAP